LSSLLLLSSSSSLSLSPLSLLSSSSLSLLDFEEEKLISIKKEEDYLDHISDLMRTINILTNELNLAKDELNIILSKNINLNKKLDDMYIDEGNGSIIVQYNELKLSLMKLQIKYDDMIIINNQNQNHYNNEIKRLNDRLLSNDNINNILRNKYEKLDDDYYKLELELQETISKLNKTEKMKETLEKFVKRSDPNFDHNLYYQYIDKLNTNDSDNNSINSKGSKGSKSSSVSGHDHHQYQRKPDHHNITTHENSIITHENITHNDNVITNESNDKSSHGKSSSDKSSNDKKKKKKVTKEKKTTTTTKTKEKPKTLMRLSKTNATTTAASKTNVVSKTKDDESNNVNESNDENISEKLMNIEQKSVTTIKYNNDRSNDDIDNDTITDSVLSDLSFVQQQLPGIKRVVFTGIKK